MWPVTLSGRLPVKALVSHYPTNKLISRESIPNRRNFPTPTMQQELLSGISPSFLKLSQSQGQVTHVFGFLRNRCPEQALEHFNDL